MSCVELRNIWDLCYSCAKNVYNVNSPNDATSFAIARLLLGTIAQESKFKDRRQIGTDGTPLKGINGGFGLAQTEYSSSIVSSLNQLRTKPEFFERGLKWLPKACADAMNTRNPDLITLMMTIQAGDPLAVLFCRYHYYFATGHSIPYTLEEQANYYKKYYNTDKGKATVAAYLDKWNKLIEPYLGEWQFGT